MTEIEAHKMSQEVINLLSPANRAKLLQRLDQGKMDINQFLGITIDGIPYKETQSEKKDDLVVSFNAQQAAEIITSVLDCSIGEPSWTLGKHVANLITIGMAADRGEKDSSKVVEFPKS